MQTAQFSEHVKAEFDRHLANTQTSFAAALRMMTDRFQLDEHDPRLTVFRSIMHKGNYLSKFISR